MTLCVVGGVLLLSVQLRRLKPISLPRFEQSKLQLLTPAKPKAITPSPKLQIDSKLVVDLSDRQVQLYKNEKLIARYPIAIGKEGWETPTGSFKVQQMIKNPVWQHPITGEKVPPGKDNPIGKRWIGFTSQGKLLIGFHGTDDYSLIGQAVSHGCLRMKNADVIALYQQVQINTPVVVRR